MAWIGDAVCMAAASALPICIQDPTPAVGSPHNGTWVAFRAISDEITTFKGVVTMCRNVTKRQCSSTQIPGSCLSATTLTITQTAAHNHTFSNWLAYQEASFGAWNNVRIADTSGNTYVHTGNLYSQNTGGGESHTHSVTNPEHTHTADTSFSVVQASRALHYIMRCA